MRLVERHIITPEHKDFKELDAMAFGSKNLYNATLYQVRQNFFATEGLLTYNELQKRFQSEGQADYRGLPAKVSQWTMKMVFQNFKSFFKALASYKEHPEKFKESPRIPKYLDKKNGRYLLTYTIQAISKREAVEDRVIHLSGSNVRFRTNVPYGCINQVRVVRKTGHYVIEVVYTCDFAMPPKEDNGRYAAIDLGVDNFATVTSNVRGLRPWIISGREIKSANRYFNKEIGKAKSVLSIRNGGKTSERIQRLWLKRSNIMDDFMHKASRHVVNQLVSDGINTLIVGKNDGWKQDADMGSRNNQNFTAIPHSRFISMLRYKCEMAGIALIEQEESYTSKASFLDLDPIPVYGQHDSGNVEFSGYRRHRGMYVRKDGKGEINADVNGSYNILRKCKPEAFAEGVVGLVVVPALIKRADLLQ